MSFVFLDLLSEDGTSNNAFTIWKDSQGIEVSPK